MASGWIAKRKKWWQHKQVQDQAWGIGVTGSNEWYSVVSRNLVWSFLASSFTQRSLKVGRETAASNAFLELRVLTNQLLIAPTTCLGSPVVICVWPCFTARV